MTPITPSTRGPRTSPAWLTGAVAVFIVLHGFAHFVGTSESLSLVTQGRAARYLGGTWLVSSPDLLRIIAIAWAVAGVALIVAGTLVWLRPATAGPNLAAALITSLALTVLGLWASVVGVIINVVLLMALAWWSRAR